MKKLLFMIIPLMGSSIQVHAMRSPKSSQEQLNDRLLDAMKDFNVEGVKQALAQGADPNTIWKYKYYPTVLMIIADATSIENKHIPIAQALLDAGADPNFMDRLGQTALFYAAQAGNAEICTMLLERGADPSILAEITQLPALETAGRRFDWRRERPSFDQFKETVIILASAIPADQQEIIRREIVGIIGVREAKPTLPRDIKRLITQKIINRLVNAQIARIKELLSERVRCSLENVAWNFGREHGQEQLDEITQILDL